MNSHMSLTPLYNHPSAMAPAQYEPTTDEKLIELWLHGLSRHTVRGYRRFIARFQDFIGKPFASVRLGDVQAFADALANDDSISSGYRALILASVKSLFGFGCRTGILLVNVPAALRVKQSRNLAARIIDESTVHKMLAKEEHPRNHALLLLLYGAGLRVSEAASLRWRDLQPNGDSGQVTVIGKGCKVRSVLLPASVWNELLALRPKESTADTAVFRSRIRGGPLTSAQIWNIVKRAGGRAGADAVSPHWMRHAHASHAIERGCSLMTVRDTLGHSSIATTSVYLHARPNDSSGRYLAI